MRLIDSDITFVSSLANQINVSMVPCKVIKRLTCERDDTLFPGCCEECFVCLAAVDMRVEVFGNFCFTGVDTIATDVKSGARFLTNSEFATSAELDRESR